MKPVGERIQTIQNIFRDVQDSFPETYSHAELAEKLNSYEVEYRSIAYEAASFCIALKDLEAGSILSNWNFFLTETGTPHATQIHVGLGWALAQKQIDPIPFITHAKPMLRYRILDGYGYYEGIFRRRKSVLGQQQFGSVDIVANSAYDQGVGRSLWYTYNADVEATVSLINRFSEERQKDLWRGIGIAITYVGGLNEEALVKISSEAGLYKPQLSAGAIMALVSRYSAGFIPQDSELICRIWCCSSVTEILNIHRTDTNTDETKAYSKWVKVIDSAF